MNQTNNQTNCSLIVIGEINTDIVVSGLTRFPHAGELVNGQELFIGPGGKARNIAAMAGVLMPRGSVAMVSKTIQDKYGLWREPITALKHSGVDTTYVQILPDDGKEFPGIALILVDNNGTNQIIGAPGITRSFDETDIDQANELFATVGRNNGFMAFIGNCPAKTAEHAIQKANQHGVKVVFDPGGADDVTALLPLLKLGIYLFKPNEHEAEAMTGIKVSDTGSAGKAARVFMDLGVENVMITAGANGAYLFSPNAQKHLAIPQIASSATHDETGCGDQTMATLCACLQKGKPLSEAAEIATMAGTLQFHRKGIQPVKPSELSWV